MNTGPSLLHLLTTTFSQSHAASPHAVALWPRAAAVCPLGMGLDDAAATSPALANMIAMSGGIVLAYLWTRASDQGWSFQVEYSRRAPNSCVTTTTHTPTVLIQSSSASLGIFLSPPPSHPPAWH